MALTQELIQANAATAGLTTEQINAIVTMSQNDENAVIAKKTGEIYGGLDNDIFSASGIEKNGTEKTYDYAKRAIGEIKAKADAAGELTTQIASLTKEKARLEKVIADGGADAETKKQLAQAQKDLAAVTKSFTDLKTEFDTAKDNHAKEIFGLRLDGELDKSVSGLKFKAGLPDAVTSVILANAKTKVKGMTPEYIDDGKGGKTLAFKDASGAIIRNPNNQLNPYTASELIEKELREMGVLETGKQTQGAGSQGGNGGNGGGASGVIDLSGARTQVEADEAITKALLAQGLTIGSDAFQTAKNKAWVDNNVKALPIQ